MITVGKKYEVKMFGEKIKGVAVLPEGFKVPVLQTKQHGLIDFGLADEIKEL